MDLNGKRGNIHIIHREYLFLMVRTITNPSFNRQAFIFNQHSMATHSSQRIFFDICIKCFSRGEHHFSVCQIMMTGVSSACDSQLSFLRRPFCNSDLTAISGQTVMPIPSCRHLRRLLTLENSRIVAFICCCSSDRSNVRR